jgi:hypothetical protein
LVTVALATNFLENVQSFVSQSTTVKCLKFKYIFLGK